MEKKKKRNSYDTRVKYLVRKGLLPDIYRKQIHRSLISKWKKESGEKYIGYELNVACDTVHQSHALLRMLWTIMLLHHCLGVD